VVAETEMAFDHVLLNLYRDGRDSIGMHADNEPELGSNPPVAAVSLGATRRFVVQRKGKRRGKPRSIPLEHGSLLVMGGTMQHGWYHGVPKTRADVGERINVTFRRLRGPPGWRE
jgi:alkylated DNA repair dioxygenase AlkB